MKMSYSLCTYCTYTKLIGDNGLMLFLNFDDFNIKVILVFYSYYPYHILRSNNSYLSNIAHQQFILEGPINLTQIKYTQLQKLLLLFFTLYIYPKLNDKVFP
jgi:hypothetical protein